VSSFQKSGQTNAFIVSDNLISYHPIPRDVEGMQCQISEKMSRVVCFQQFRTENIKINKVTVATLSLVLSLLLNFGTVIMKHSH